eukprot:1146313-Pyramimonas_sp.AAC.1
MRPKNVSWVAQNNSEDSVARITKIVERLKTGTFPWGKSCESIGTPCAPGRYRSKSFAVCNWPFSSCLRNVGSFVAGLNCFAILPSRKADQYSREEQLPDEDSDEFVGFARAGSWHRRHALKDCAQLGPRSWELGTSYEDISRGPYEDISRVPFSVTKSFEFRCLSLSDSTRGRPSPIGFRSVCGSVRSGCINVVACARGFRQVDLAKSRKSGMSFVAHLPIRLSLLTRVSIPSSSNRKESTLALMHQRNALRLDAERGGLMEGLNGAPTRKTKGVLNPNSEVLSHA